MRHGILLIDKPKGPTSHDIVQMVRKTLGERSIGHLGTLDPAASGLLVLFVGKKALKCIELFKDASKAYEARVCFGSVSTTYDSEGVIEEVPAKKGWKPPTDIALRETLESHFLGSIRQIPPAYSAIHIDGKRAYEVIRANPDQELTLPERTICIHRIQLISYAFPKACIAIECSSGTYIRSFAHDLGQVLRCGAYLEGLRRTKVGAWDCHDALAPEAVAWGNILPLKEILVSFPRYDLSPEQYEDILHGRSIMARTDGPEPIAWYEELPVAILERKEGKAHPRKVL